MTPRTQLVLLGFLLLAGVQPSFADEVVRDEWTASYEGEVKTSWHYQRITKTKAGYAEEFRSWRRSESGGVTEVEQTTTTDAQGHILTQARKERGWWGTKEFDLSPGGPDTLAWWFKDRHGKETSGTLGKGQTFLGSVYVERILAGELKPGKHEVPRLARGQTYTHTFDVRQKDGLWEVDSAGYVCVRKRDRTFVRSYILARPFFREEPTTKAESASLDQRPKTKLVECKERREGLLDLGMVAVHRGKGVWKLSLESQPPSVRIQSGVADTTVSPLPFRIPMDDQKGGILSRWIQDMESGGYALTKPEPMTFAGRESHRFHLTHELRKESGVAYLITHEGRTVLLVQNWPTDLTKRTEADRRRMLAAIHLKRPAPAGWTLIDAKKQGVSFLVPKNWSESPQSAPSARHFISPIQASQIGLTDGELPPGMTAKSAQEIWVSRQRSNPSIKDFKVERAEDIKISGRPARRVIVSGEVENEGVKMNYRAASVLLLGKDRTYTELTVVAFDFDWEPKAVDKVVKSFSVVRSY